MNATLFLPNEPIFPHWRYQKRRFSQKTNPNEPVLDVDGPTIAMHEKKYPSRPNNRPWRYQECDFAKRQTQTDPTPTHGRQ
jgi:hypothetical protein